MLVSTETHTVATILLPDVTVAVVATLKPSLRSEKLITDLEEGVCLSSRLRPTHCCDTGFEVAIVLQHEQ